MSSLVELMEVKRSIGSIGVIGGSGFYSLSDAPETDTLQIDTPYSDNPVPMSRHRVANQDVHFITRHGKKHGIPPHKVNYRANLKALAGRNVSAIIAVNIVGGISEDMPPGTLVIPDQIIDYTWGREHTFFDVLDAPENHVDFSWPYDQDIGRLLTASANSLHMPVKSGAVYACTQGPRLETAAEIIRLKNDGCDIVGMTAMPEAALARELRIPYASIALVVNWAAGLTEDTISFEEISDTLEAGIARVRQIVLATITTMP